MVMLMVLAVEVLEMVVSEVVVLDDDGDMVEVVAASDGAGWRGEQLLVITVVSSSLAILLCIVL